jgi:exoribonuclease R
VTANTPQLDLQAVAKTVVQAHGFQPDFSPEIQQQLQQLRSHPPTLAAAGSVRDLRNQLWSSIDNDTSRDLDQIEVAERLPNGDTKVLIGIADVDAFAAKSTAIDQHAARETTTVYTGIRVFPMLPEELSTGKTSLLEHQDCLSVVTEFVVDTNGHVSSSDVYRALVRNQAQL